jgi:hypothetical protein
VASIGLVLVRVNVEEGRLAQAVPEFIGMDINQQAATVRPAVRDFHYVERVPLPRRRQF